MGGNVKDIDRGWKNIVKELTKAKQPFVKVGVLSDAETKDGQNLASIAAYNEFGTSKIPSRPFMAQTFDLNNSQTKRFIDKEYGKVLDRKQSIADGLYKIGIFYQEKTQSQISLGKFAPNKPATIKAKGSSKPLIDTGRLRKSINFEVVLK